MKTLRTVRVETSFFSQSLIILSIRSLFSGSCVYIVMGAFRTRYIVLIQDSGKAVDWGTHEEGNQGRELFVKPNRLLKMLHKFIRYFVLPRLMDSFS